MFTALLGAVSQGILWGVMVLGVYITYKLLDIPDLTADGSFAFGGCVLCGYDCKFPYESFGGTYILRQLQV